MKWTLITGGAQNLGAALSLKFAKEGKPVLLQYRKSDKHAEKLIQEIKAEGGIARALYGDFSTEQTTRDFLSLYQRECAETENIIHNVGNYLVKPASETSLQEMKNLFETNFYAPFHITKTLLPSIKKHRGNLIFIGIAGVGDHRAETFSTAYHMTKLCLFQLTKSLAKELAPYHVRANMISPGYLENSMSEDQAKKRLPFKRTASFDEIARCVSFLCSEKAAYITGQNLEIAGGVRL